MRVLNKDQSKELAKALEKSKKLEDNLHMSERTHRNFQRQAEKDRAELEQSYLASVDQEVMAANQILNPESQYQEYEANLHLEQQLARVTAQASEAMAAQQSSSDQRLAIAAQETQQKMQSIQQWTEHRSSELQRELGAARAEGTTLKQQLSHASAEIDHLKSAVALEAQKLQRSEALNQELAKRIEDKDLLLAKAGEEQHRLQVVIQEGKRMFPTWTASSRVRR